MKTTLKKFIKLFLNEEDIYKIRYFFIKRKTRKMSEEDKKKALDEKFYKIHRCNIDWDNPNSLSEKIQYAKLFDDYETMQIKARLSDKYLVRKWVEKKLGIEYLIPLIGVYDSFDEIDFDKLPKSFVIKCNHDSGSVMLVKDKSTLNLKKMRKKYNFYLKRDFSDLTLEKHYTYIAPKIIIEEYIHDVQGELNDYKFWCFDSKVYFCRVDFDRFGSHRRNTYDLEWNLLPWVEGNYENYEGVAKPEAYNKMIEIASLLSQNMPQVRVDLYCINNKIYFGEMTFSSGSGFEYIESDVNLMLGSLWNLDEKYVIE